MKDLSVVQRNHRPKGPGEMGSTLAGQLIHKKKNGEVSNGNPSQPQG